jgi:hypothetical protein
MKKTENSANGTSFHGVTITTSIEKLTKVLGEPSYIGDYEDKVTVEWVCELEDGSIVTVYDWKEYRKISEFENIEFHIGGMSKMKTFDAQSYLVTKTEELC